ncbi:sorbitol-6-phosphate 2-dehydrogenase [Salmonella enterica subsp. enterica]|nr:sorbitol-6-phosphate 2-dehydrogenase [Salmonella enterica subsp. enterica]
MSPRKLTPILAKVWRTVLAPTLPASRACWALSRGVDEIFGRVDLLVYSAGIAKAAFISDFQLGDFDRSLQVNLVGYFLCAREFFPPDDPRRHSGAHYSD